MRLNYRLGDKPSLGVWRTFWVGEIGLARVEVKFWCYLNDIYMTMCMTVCIIVYHLYRIMELCSYLKLHLNICIKK